MATPDAGGAPRFVFVLGTGRCGSTLVEEVLCRHPSVGFVSNLEDRFNLPASAGRWNGRLYRRLPAAATQKSRLRYAPSEGYRVLAREVTPMLATPLRDLTESDVTPWLERRFSAFMHERAQAQSTDTFLHKFTGWPRAGFIREIFPSARFIHVVRDGRAVANSWLQMPWWRGFEGPDHWQWGPLPPKLEAAWEELGRSFVVLAGLLWQLLIELVRQRSRDDSVRGLARGPLRRRCGEPASDVCLDAHVLRPAMGRGVRAGLRATHVHRVTFRRISPRPGRTRCRAPQPHPCGCARRPSLRRLISTSREPSAAPGSSSRGCRGPW